MSAGAAYTIEEVLANFRALLATMDFTRELAAMEIKRLHFRRRQRFLREMRALTFALWYLALRRSFPNDCQMIFDTCLNQITENATDADEARDAQNFLELVYGYVALLHEKGDSDFMGVSSHIVRIFMRPDADIASKSLKLALLIRDNYTIIFQRLI